MALAVCPKDKYNIDVILPAQCCLFFEVLKLNFVPKGSRMNSGNCS